MKKFLQKIIPAFAVLFITISAFAITREEAFKEIFPDAGSFEQKKNSGIDYVEVYKSGRPEGYCLNVTAGGYGGPICMVVGIDPEGIIKGVRIIAHCETPGIGARINEPSPGEKRPWFLEQFIGKQGRTVALKRDIDGVSGATISSNAVTTAINGAVGVFLSEVKKLER